MEAIQLAQQLSHGVNFKNEVNKAENEEEKQCADSSDIYNFF